MLYPRSRHGVAPELTKHWRTLMLRAIEEHLLDRRAPSIIGS